MQLMVIFGIVIAVLAVAFAMQNAVPVTVAFLVWRFDGSLALIVLLSIAIGALIIALVSTPAALRAKWSASRQRKEIESLKQSNADLRSRIAALELQSPRGEPAAAPPAEPSLPGVVGLKSIVSQFGSPARGPRQEG